MIRHSHSVSVVRLMSAKPVYDDGAALLAKLREYYRAYGVLPSYTHMGRLCGWNAKSWSQTLVARLEKAGYFARTPFNQLMPGPKFFEV